MSKMYVIKLKIITSIKSPSIMIIRWLFVTYLIGKTTSNLSYFSIENVLNVSAINKGFKFFNILDFSNAIFMKFWVRTSLKFFPRTCFNVSWEIDKHTVFVLVMIERDLILFVRIEINPKLSPFLRFLTVMLFFLHSTSPSRIK